MASPLILTKLRVPTPRPRLVHRPRLIERLAPEIGTGLILVVAPAGYGKSTLLTEWSQSLQQTGVAVAWYALDPSDDVPGLFGSYLVAGLAQALGPLPELGRAAQLLRSSPEIDLQAILPAVINAVAASDRDCVLVLDDYHLIGSAAIHSAVTFLVERLPKNLHVVIGSRSDPPLPLARLRARGQLREIRAADLKFTEDETAQFMNAVMHLELSPEWVAVLETRTEGWIAGLQLAALSLSSRSDKEAFIAAFTGSNRYLVEYLLEEVVNDQPEEVQSFLLRTSILERLCGPLCDALLGKPSGGEAILERLYKANLFVVALDEEGYWYRYHHLFGDFLQTRLRKAQPERTAALHRAASEWYAAHGLLREAVQHAFQTHDWAFAAALVEQHGFTLIVHSELSTLYEWCSAFPEEVLRQHPMLAIFQCWPLVFRFRRENRGRIEARLQQAEQVISAMDDRPHAGELREHAAIVRTYLAMAPDPTADPREQLALTETRLGAYPEADAGQFSALLTSSYAHMALHDAQAATTVLEKAKRIALQERLYFGVVESTFELARLAHCQGRLHRAAEICRQGQADIATLLAHPEQELPALGCLDIALGGVLLEQDQLEEAERALLHGLELIGLGMNPFYLMVAYLALFRLREVQGRSAEALEFLSRLEQTWPDIAFCTGAFRVTHALRMAPEDPSTLAEATTWCQAFSASLGEEVSPPGVGLFGAAEAYYLAYLGWARAQIAIGQPQAAQTYLQRQLALAEAHSLTNRVIELSLLEAQAARAQGDDERAWAALEHALMVAQPEGYLRIFDQGADLNRLLVEAGGRGISPDYIERILAIVGGPKAVDAGRAISLEFGETVSDRELEVLRLMARGATNQEIAEQLVITVGTVKSHINHILGKLESRNRTEAVARARELGLLET